MIDKKKFNILRGIVMASYLPNEEKREVLDFLTELSEQPKADWIPCEERLPNGKVNPITLDYYTYPCIYQNDGIEDIRYYSFGKGHWRHGFEIMDDYVTHWFDIYGIPQSYKKEGAE